MADFWLYEEAGRMRRLIGDGVIVCDPSLDHAIRQLPQEVRDGIRAGKSYTFAQVERIKALAREAKEKRDIP